MYMGVVARCPPFTCLTDTVDLQHCLTSEAYGDCEDVSP